MLEIKQVARLEVAQYQTIIDSADIGKPRQTGADAAGLIRTIWADHEQPMILIATFGGRPAIESNDHIAVRQCRSRPAIDTMQNCG